MQIKLYVVSLGLIFAGFSLAANAESRYYNPSNSAPGNDAGKTVGYQLYRSIGCPGQQLLDSDCPAEASDVSPVTASSPEPTPAPVTASLPAPAPAPAPAPVKIAKAETPLIANKSASFCNIFQVPTGSNPYLSGK